MNKSKDTTRQIVICGKSFIASDVVRHIVDMNAVRSVSLAVSVLSVSSDAGRDTWEPSLIKTARNLNVPIIHSFKACRLTKNDSILSLEYNKIIHPEEIGAARAYNIHFSNLPKYRGCLTSVWPIRNGEEEAGVTLHIMTEPVDSGDIIDQILFPIPPGATCYDLYRLYNRNAFELFKRNYTVFFTGVFRAAVQDHSKVTYYKRSSVDFRDTDITEFNKPASVVSQYIRSLIFEPYQLPTFGEKSIIQCDIISGTPKQKPSTVVLKDETHAIVTCRDGYLRMFFR